MNIDDLIEDTNALMENIKEWMDCNDKNSVETQKLVQLADELIEALLVEKENL